MGVYRIRLTLDSYTASRRRTGLRYKSAKTIHGNKNRVKAFGFKAEKFALAA